MKHLPAVLTLLLALPFTTQAKTIWIAQSSAGTDDGSNASNAHSAAWFNSAANWGLLGTQINPGDTVMLSGTVTSPLVFQGSGTIGNVITLKFDSGARMTKAHWNQGGTNDDAAISATGRSYITVDGGTNGIIEATANGTALANQLASNGVVISGPSVGVTVKNLTVQHLYQRTAGSADSNYICNCIWIKNGLTDVTVSGNTTTDSGTGIEVGYRLGDSGLQIFGNTCSKHGIAVDIGSAAAGATLTNSQVYNNDLSGDTTWSGFSGVHMNCIHIYAVQDATTLITNLKVYGNYFHGNMGVFPTSLAFLEGYITAPLIYDNVFFHDTFVGGNGDLTLKGANGAIILNNTFVTNAGGTAIGTTDWLGTETFSMANNIFLNYTNAVYDATNGKHAVTASDNNLIYPNATTFRFNGQVGQSFSQWQAAGFDTHGVQLAPALDASYVPDLASPAVDAGTPTVPGTLTAISSLFSSDKATSARVAGSASDIGAYEVPQTTAVIVTQPADTTVVFGTTATFSVLARGQAPLSYQWKLGGTDLSNDSTYSGVTTATLTITNPTLALDGGQYTCVVSNNYNGGSTATSTTATLHVTKILVTPHVTANNKTYDGGTAATIATATLTGVAPADVGNLNLVVGSASFSDASVGPAKTVTASVLSLSGSAAVNYQLTASSATTTANITALSISPTVTVSDKVYDTFTTATITGRSLSGVLGGDTANVSLTGGTATFSTAAAGPGRTVNVTGLSLTGSAASNYVLSSTSATATANISPAPATVTLSNLSQVYNNSPRSVTVTTVPASLPVTTTYNGSGTAPTGGGTYTVVSTVTDTNYTGSATNTLTITPAAQTITFGALTTKTFGDPDFALTATSSSGLTVVYTSTNTAVATIINGNTVHLVGPGTTTINATQPGNANYASATLVPQTLTVLGTAPAFTQQPTPATKTVAPSGVASFTVVASGVPAPTFAWEYSANGTTWNPVPNLTPYAGVTSASLQILGAQQSQDGLQFRCVATNAVSSTTSNAATFHVNVNAPLFTTNPTDTTVTEGANVSWTLAATGNPAPTFQWQVSSDGVTWTNLTDTAPYTGTATATLAITATPLNLNGKKFRCIATNSFDACNSFAATLTVNPLVPVTSAPVVWEDPISRTASIGGSVLFSVSGTGSPGPSSQWRHNGVAITGATNLSLSLTNIQVTDGGSYDVVLSNSVGSVTSKPATLTIDSSPIITSQPTGVSVTTGGTATFNVAAQGITPLSYQWRKNGVAIPGATGTTLTLANVQPTDAAAYDVVITNSLGTKTSNSALLAVNAKSFAGQYFGTLSGGGTWALSVNADNTGTFIAYLSDRSTGIVTNVVIDASGSFSASTSEIGSPTSTSAASNANGHPVAADTTGVTSVIVSGSISGGKLTGSVSGLNQSLSGNVDIGVNSNAGYYKAAAIGATQATTYTVVGASGHALVVSSTGSAVDGASGTVDSTGILSGKTILGATLTIAIDSGHQLLTAHYTGAQDIQFSGLAASAELTTRLTNISARAGAGTGSGTLIAGFTVTGSGSKSLLIRGVGPSLAAYLPNSLPDPVLSLYSGQTVIANNDDWSTAANADQVATVSNSLNAFPLTRGSLDGVLLTSQTPGIYTAEVTAKPNSSGVALVEIYDAADSTARLTNVSARAQVGTGANVFIVGFTVIGNGPKQYLVRAIGPSLTQFNVTGVLANPQLSVMVQGTSTVLAQNDDWSGTTTLQNAFNSVKAFGLDPASKDAATVVTLTPGSYSVVVSGVNNTTGVALVEVYELP